MVAVTTPCEEQGRGRNENSREEDDGKPEAGWQLRRDEGKEGKHQDPGQDSVKPVHDHRGGRGADREVRAPVCQRHGPADVADLDREEVVEKLAGVKQAERPLERDRTNAPKQDVPSDEPQELRRRHESHARE